MMIDPSTASVEPWIYCRSAKVLAAELCISLNTTKTHMRNILAKLHATSRHQAAAYAVQEGLIHPPGQGSVLHE